MNMQQSRNGYYHTKCQDPWLIYNIYIKSNGVILSIFQNKMKKKKKKKISKISLKTNRQWALSFFFFSFFF
jgi:hypothetical protein